MFLNLYPEHLEAHGGMEGYKKAKSKLFSSLKTGGYLIYNSSKEQIEYSNFMLQSAKQATRQELLVEPLDTAILDIKPIKDQPWFLQFKLDEGIVMTNFMADFEIENLAFAIKIIKFISLQLDRNIDFFDIQKATSAISANIPGRMDWVKSPLGFNTFAKYEIKNNSHNLGVLVDYAHEPASIKALLENLNRLKKLGMFDKIIHVISCDGAGRDDWKKSVMGNISMEKADFTVVTTDNYDQNDNPDKIIELITKDFASNFSDKDFASDIDRKKAFKIALEKAKDYKSAVIVSTGVGSEYGLTSPNGIIDWNEKKVWQELLY